MALELGLEQAIHERWGGAAALTSLVPLARVFTGSAVDNPALPYVIWRRDATAPVARTSSGRNIGSTRVRCEIRAEQLTTAKLVAQGVFEEFNRSALVLPAGACLTMQHVAHEESLAPEGWWLVLTVYELLHEGAG